MRALHAEHLANWEWVVTVAALFLLGRTPILFLRLRLAGLFGGRTSPLWQDDLVVLFSFAAIIAVMVVIAARRANVAALLHQPLLLATVAVAWLSVAWSVEPAVTLRRSLLFAGTAVVGWYIGDRFSPRDQARLVIRVAWVGVATSLVALAIWPDLATSSGRNLGWFSGAYVNRNALGLVLSTGLLASLFLFWETKRKAWVAAGAVLLLAMLFATKNRTGPVALVVAVVITLSVHWLRKNAKTSMTAAGGALFFLTTFGTVGFTIHYYWVEILGWLGRDVSLTRRTDIWQLVRFFSGEKSWFGWGFEAIWANSGAIGKAQAARGALHAHMGPGVPGGWPYAAHNGYFEMLLSVGRVGFAIFLGFLVVATWRAFEFAWQRRDMSSLWPLSFIVFAVVTNFSESAFVSSEALWALTVAAAVGATECARRQHASVGRSDGG